MRKVQSGKTDSFSVLYDRYCDYLYSYFYRLSNNQQISEDLTQNVFLRIIRYKSSFKNKMSFKSWIFQIARNQFYDYKDKKETEIKLELSKNNEFDEYYLTQFIEQTLLTTGDFIPKHRGQFCKHRTKPGKKRTSPDSVGSPFP